jgi:hypothetical protein
MQTPPWLRGHGHGFAFRLGLPAKLRSEEIPRNRLGTVFVIAEKSTHSAEFRVHQNSQFRSSEPNETKRNSAEIIKFYETANKSRRFSSVFCSKNGSEQIFKCFLIRK